MKRPEIHLYDLGNKVTAFSTTRKGGYSEGPYGQFNINCYCGDEPTAIQKNRAALCELLGIDDSRLLMPHQVHQTKVAVIDEAYLKRPHTDCLQLLEGVDALMTDVRGVCIGVSTADCIPVLLYDEEHHAVCAVHAGWRGTVKRIVQQAVLRMADTYGTRPASLVAQIGPGISLDSFEVGDEVYETFQHEGFQMSTISRKDEKWHIDLPACNRLQLLDVGVESASIHHADICTYKHCEDYFSARRLGIQSGRIFTGILCTK